MKHRIVALFLLVACAAFGQNVSSTINGTAVDPSGAAIPGAQGSLADAAKGLSRTFSTGPDGTFVIPNVAPGTYELTLQAGGFKKLTMRDLMVTGSEIRSLGRLTLELGGLAESVTVEARGTPVQLSSGEKSGLVTGQQIADIAVKGRDFVSYLVTIPGIVDTGSAGREALTRNALGGIHINGGRQTSALMTVDGIPSMDAGNNGTPDEPNLDAIAEVKIMTSNYQAEYGRNAGGLVTVVTRSGSRQFHGSAYEYYRHESLNANDFFNNRTGTPKAPYRYRITGYSLGGPVFVPGKFNTGRDKLFFFFSQELIGSRVNMAPQFINVPTQAERNGDYSRSFDVSGVLIPVRDPVSGLPFPGNIIPRDRFSKLGQSMLNFLPLPNYTDPDPRNLYRRNYRTIASGGWPRRQEVVRIDYNSGPLQVFYRLVEDFDRRELQTGAGGWPAGNLNYVLTPVIWSRPARAQVVQATHVISPTLVNQFSFSRTFNSVDTWPVNPSVLGRAAMGDPPQWFKDTRKEFIDWIPGLTFGSVPANTANTTIESRLPGSLPNAAYILTQSLSKVWQAHTLKAGLYVERNNKVQAATSNVRGVFNFGRDTNNPLDSGHGYANALLGNFLSYSEANNQREGDYLFWDVEWFVQDNWRVTRRLTLDVGLRFYHVPPTADRGGALAAFVPSLYDPAKAPALYVPALDASRKRVARDPLTGALAPPPLIGLFVPGSGDFANGSRAAGSGLPQSLYTTPWLSLGPRFGFAYDVFGNGKTAIRGGFGRFGDKVTGNTIYNSAGNPPVTFTPVLYYGNLETFTQNTGVFGPSNVTAISGRHPLPTVTNFSLSVQHQLRSMMIDVGYVGSLGRHLSVQRNLNALPMFARFDLPKNADPTQPTVPLQDNFLRPYRGYGNINSREFTGTSNYHSLQMSANRRFARGLQFGVSYTWSKVLTVAGDDNGGLSSYFPWRAWNYGPADYDQPHTLVFNYMYSVPKLGSRIGWAPAGWALDNWQVSGITTFASGNPFTPGMSTVDGQDITGSTDGARITLAGDPRLSKSEKTFYRTFNTNVFRRTPQRSFGNAGVNILYGPGINNWDIAISKRAPLFSESRYVQFRTELFNAWNHTQFSGVFTGARFDRNGVQVDPNFGAYSATFKPRNIQLSLKLIF